MQFLCQTELAGSTSLIVSRGFVNYFPLAKLPDTILIQLFIFSIVTLGVTITHQVLVDTVLLATNNTSEVVFFTAVFTVWDNRLGRGTFGGTHSTFINIFACFVVCEVTL